VVIYTGLTVILFLKFFDFLSGQLFVTIVTIIQAFQINCFHLLLIVKVCHLLPTQKCEKEIKLQTIQTSKEGWVSGGELLEIRLLEKF
jgi:hypothetical protein